MSLSEFELIDQFFRRAPRSDSVLLGIGDDAAVLRVPAGKDLVVAMDTLVAGRHFPDATQPFDIGYKALAVNLSDMAAMGAEPAWATLSLTLPAAQPEWLRSFAEGFFTLANQYRVELVGGDTTRGPLSITVQVHGLVQAGRMLRRDAARPGQSIFVTGTLGDAAWALQRSMSGNSVDPFLLQRLNRPEPRVAFGRALAEFGAAAIDVSDGLLADLGHVVQASDCGAALWVDRLPRSQPLLASPADEVRSCQLSGGDDYELCFTVEQEYLERVQQVADAVRLPVTEIGVIEERAGVRCWLDDGTPYRPQARGFDHFADE